MILPSLKRRWKELITKHYNYEASPVDNMMNVAKVASDFDTLVVFLDRSPIINMLIACGKDGKPLEKPDGYDEWLIMEEEGTRHSYDGKCFEYQQAEAQILFKGFEVNKAYVGMHDKDVYELNNNIYFIQDECYHNYDLIESLEQLCESLELTEIGIKESGI